MKKLVFMFIAMVAMTFAACGNKTVGTASQNDSDTVVVDTDSIAVDSLADTLVVK